MSAPIGEDVTYWFRIVPPRCLATREVFDDPVSFDDVAAERNESATSFMAR